MGFPPTRRIRTVETFDLHGSNGCLLETEDTVAPPPLPQEATTEAGRGTGGGGGGGMMSTNTVNPGASRARGIAGGGGGGGSTGGRKTNAGKSSQSSVGTVTTPGAGASKMNIDAQEGAAEEMEPPMDAR